jgi:hypothetical protein
MNNPLFYWTAALLALSSLAACTDKTVNAPAAAQVAAPAKAAPAKGPDPVTGEAAEPPSPPHQPQFKTATMACPERKIVVEASCLDLYGPSMLQCTRQSLTVFDAATGKQLNTRAFVAIKGDSDDPPTVEEKIGEMQCVTAKSGEKFIVTSMSNGGNCEQCEWHEVYGWDGAYRGWDRDKKASNKLVKEALDALNEEDVDNATGFNDMDSFYTGAAEK